MKARLLLLLTILIISASTNSYSQKKTIKAIQPDTIKWQDAQTLTIEGQGWTDLAYPYDRLPQHAKTKVRKAVWDLSEQTAGICLHFYTNSTIIQVQWKLRFNSSMPHMTACGIKGIDIYAREKSTMQWKWAGVGKPWFANNHVTILKNMIREMREYKLYFPLYDGIDSIAVGIDSGSSIIKYSKQEKETKPILFYGTSITQGCSASRPGMAYPAIIGRFLDVETINLGFSGNGKMEMALAELIAEVDASCYVIDCLPNMTPEMVTERTEPFIKHLREIHPLTPIVLVESIRYDHSWLNDDVKNLLQRKNNNLKSAYTNLINSGIRDLYYIESNGLTGYDNDTTIDGVHMTDIGFQRFSNRLTEVLTKLLIK